jgi:hypothetical protein
MKSLVQDLYAALKILKEMEEVLAAGSAIYISCYNARHIIQNIFMYHCD